MSTTATSANSLRLDSIPKQTLFGIETLAITMPELLDLADRAIEQRCQLNIGQLSGPTLVRIHRDADMCRSLLAANIFVADGAGVLVASRILRRPLPTRLAGIDIMYGLMDRANQHSHRVFLLGAEQWVVDKVHERWTQEYPNAKIVGKRNGYFTSDQEAEVAQQVKQSGADILFVAITSPTKEHFLATWGAEVGVPILHGVGGSFDVVAGKVTRAPELAQRLSLEWAYRIYQEPKRLWRRVGMANLLFVGLVGWEVAANLVRPEGANWAKAKGQ